MQYEKELENANVRAKNQIEEFDQLNREQQENLQRSIEQRQEKLRWLEEQLEDRSTPSYFFSSSPSPTADLLINRALWKLCPSGIWV